MHKQTKFLHVQNKLMQLAYKLSVLLRRLLEVFYKGALSAAHSLELCKCRRGNLGTAVPKINRDSAVTQASVDWNFTSESLVVICCFSGQKVSTAARASWQQWGDTAHEIQSSCFFNSKTVDHQFWTAARMLFGSPSWLKCRPKQGPGFQVLTDLTRGIG